MEHAHRVLVNGKIDGNIYAAERCDLFESSKVRGDIHYGVMGIEHGAEIYGELLKKSTPTLTVKNVSPVEFPQYSDTSDSLTGSL